MDSLNFPVIEIEKNKFQVTIDISIYAKEAIAAVCYKYSNLYYIHQQSDQNNHIFIIFEAKDNSSIAIDIPKQFYNDLLDQQVRYDTNKKFGHIRDMIVEEAFKPITR